MRFGLVAALILLHFRLFAQDIYLPYSMKNVPGPKFVHDTLTKYAQCRFGGSFFPGYQKSMVSLRAGHYSRQKLWQAAFPHERLKDTSYTDDGEQVVAVSQDKRPAAKKTVPVKLADSSSNMNDMPADTVRPTYPNGFQHLPFLTTTSSVSSIPRASLDRNPALNIVGKFDHIASGAFPNANNSLGLSIRGRSSIWSYNSPLLVVNNFAWYGSPNDINPHDVDSVTILKDAASSAIWGSFSSNTVIVLSTGEGRYKQKPLFTANFSTTTTEKPDLSYLPQISNDSFISAETQFFNNGYYIDPNYPLSPAVEILRKWKDKSLSDADAHAQLSKLASQSLFSDLSRDFYRNSVARDYHVSVSGGGETYKYYLGLGLNTDKTTLQQNGYQRRTMHGSFTFHPLPRLEAGITFSSSGINQNLSNPGTIPVSIPYLALADANGNALAIPYKYNSETDTNSLLLNREYRPLDELHRPGNRNDYAHINTYGQLNLNWFIRPKWTASLLYRQSRGRSTQTNTQDSASFYVHDLFDQSVIQGNTMPLGGMSLINDTIFIANNARGQISYTSNPLRHQQLIAMAGIELSDWTAYGSITQKTGIGVHPESATSSYNSYTLSEPGPGSVNSPVPGMNNTLVSAFSNASYTWRQQYSVSGSLRKDGSNSVAVDEDHKGMLFWSLGFSRQWIKNGDSAAGTKGRLFKLRTSYGCSGNLSNRSASLATQSLSSNVYGYAQSGITSAPDPHRRWERNYMLNLGVDVQLLKDSIYPQGRFSLSFDVYSKRVKDVLGEIHLPLSSGVTDFWSNTAEIHGDGVELSVNTDNKWGQTSIRSSLLLSVARDWIGSSPAGTQAPQTYVNKGYPMRGKPVNALNSYKYMGLDSVGDPLGKLNGQTSKDYVNLLSDPNAAVVNSGASQPQLFGYWQNTIGYHGFSFSAGISLKAAFVMRRPAVNYGAMAAGLSAGAPDYYRRWQRPGDEKITNVPALPLENQQGRDEFYDNSEATVIRGDFVRLQDCRLSYRLTEAQCHMFRLKEAEFYIYVNNPGILWRANKYGLDPDATLSGGFPAPRTWTIGTQIKF